MPASVWSRVFRGAEPLSGNRLRLLCGSREFFPALVEAIDAARYEVHLETYIFHADAGTLAVRDALVRAARRGVRVQVLIDGLGSRDFSRLWREQLSAAGVQLLVYRPPATGWRASPRSLRRLHRKLAVIDAAVAFVGGINLIDDHWPPRMQAPRLDFSVRIEGPLLAEIHRSARRLWRLVAITQLNGVPDESTIEAVVTARGDIRAAFVVRDNLAHRRDIERGYLAALALARHEIDIANAYFLPGRRFRTLLKRAAARGVRVRLLVQGHTDHRFFQAAARALYRDLLAAGVSIHEYQASEMHAKVAVIDGRWATVGSSNIDPLSLLLAREANVAVDDPGFSGELRRQLDAAFVHAPALDPERWHHRPWPHRVFSWLAYGLVRALVGLAGGGRWT